MESDWVPLRFNKLAWIGRQLADGQTRGSAAAGCLWKSIHGVCSYTP